MCQSKNKTSEILTYRQSRQQTPGQVAEIQKYQGRIRLETDLSHLGAEDLLVAELEDVFHARPVAREDVVYGAFSHHILDLAAAEGILMRKLPILILGASRHHGLPDS